MKKDKSPLGHSNRGDGPRDFSNLGLVSSFMINQKPLGQRKVAGDDTTGALVGFPNPLWARGINTDFHNNAAYRNHFRALQEQLLWWDTNILLTNQLKTRTPFPSPNIIPVNIRFY